MCVKEILFEAMRLAEGMGEEKIRVRQRAAYGTPFPVKRARHLSRPLLYIQVNELTLLFTRGTALGRRLRIDEYMASTTVGILTGRASLRLSRIAAICAFPVVHESSTLSIDKNLLIG